MRPMRSLHDPREMRLYERFGFEREGVQRAFAFRAGAYADALAMARVRLFAQADPGKCP